jgi:hypothetical protein
MKKYLKNFHILGLLITALVMSVTWAFYELHQSNLKYKYIIITNQSAFKTIKIDSTSNGKVYFKDRNGDNTIVSGSYIIKEINRDERR